MNNKSKKNHHHNKRYKIKHWIKHNRSIIFIIIIVIIFTIASFIDNQNKNYSNNIEKELESKSNYDAIITVIDGETESKFTEVWGSLIADGYPICSDFVTSNIGKEGYMSWETVEALNNLGVEFVFHASKHTSYNELSVEEIKYDIEYGLNKLNEHGIKPRVINWLSSTKSEICEIGKQYFDCGIVNLNVSNTIIGDKSNKMMINDIYGYRNDSYYSYEELALLIDTAIQNNGWVVIFTRNNAPMMDQTQIDIYRQAFEYAKEHNVAVVTASEGYDLYYGNKLGNH